MSNKPQSKPTYNKVSGIDDDTQTSYLLHFFIWFFAHFLIKYCKDNKSWADKHSAKIYEFLNKFDWYNYNYKG